MLYLRGRSLEYDQWAQLGCREWSFNQVLPYFSSRWRAGDQDTATGAACLNRLAPNTSSALRAESGDTKRAKPPPDTA
jgi:choline dehydrogenase-like flavoprotein